MRYFPTKVAVSFYKWVTFDGWRFSVFLGVSFIGYLIWKGDDCDDRVDSAKFTPVQPYIDQIADLKNDVKIGNEYRKELQYKIDTLTRAYYTIMADNTYYVRQNTELKKQKLKDLKQ